MSGSQLHPVQSDSVRLQSSAAEIGVPLVQVTAAGRQAYQRLNLRPDTVKSPDAQAGAGGEGMWGAAEDVSEVESADQDGATEVVREGIERAQRAADDHEVGEPCATTTLSRLSTDCTISGEPRTTAESKSLSRQFTKLWQRFSTAVS